MLNFLTTTKVIFAFATQYLNGKIYTDRIIIIWGLHLPASVPWTSLRKHPCAVCHCFKLLTESNHYAELTSIVTGDFPYTVSMCVRVYMCVRAHTHMHAHTYFHLHKESGKYKFKMAKIVKSNRYWVGCGQQELLQKNIPKTALDIHQVNTINV